MSRLPLSAAVLFLVLPAAALAQDPYSQVDPFESRFKAHPNFQVKFHPPEKGGEVRIYSKNPVRFEKDQFWEGSEDVVIEYQDIKSRERQLIAVVRTAATPDL